MTQQSPPDADSLTRSRPPAETTESIAREFPARVHWASADQAAAYRHARHPSRYSRFFDEEAIVSPWLDGLNRGASVLDVPCGTGRWIAALAGRGFRYTGADVSLAMAREARALTGPPAVRGLVVADLARLPFPEESFDAVIIWRLLHHVPDSQTRRVLLAEAARVSRDIVIVSFHHPISFTYAWKVVRRHAFGFRQGGRGITQWQLGREALSSGLEVVETRSFCKYASINWFACLRKRDGIPAVKTA